MAFVEGAEAIWTGLVDMLTGIWTSITETASIAWEEFTQFLSDIWMAFVEGAEVIWTGLVDLLTDIWTSLVEIATNTWDTIVSTITDIVTAFIEQVINVFSTMSEGITEIFEGLSNFFSITWESIKQIFTDALDTIYSGLEDGWNKLKGVTESVFNAVKSFLGDVWANVKTTVVNTATQLVTSTIQKFLEFKIAIESKMTEVKKVITDIWDKVVSFFSEIDLRTIGKDIIQGLINGIGDMANLVWEKARSIATSIGDAIKGTLKINSPSRVMIAIGKGVGEGLAKGIEQGSEGVNRAADKLAEAAIPNFTPYLSISKEVIEKAQQIIRNATQAHATEMEALQKEAENKRIDISQKATEKITAIKANAAKQQIALTDDQVAQIKKIEEQALKDRESITKQYADKMANSESSSEDVKFKALKEYVEAQKSAGEMSTKQEAEFWQYSATTFKEEIVLGTGETVGTMNEVGKNAIQGLIDGMMGMQSSLQETANNLVRNVSGTLKKALNLNPTSSILGESLANGFESVMNKATNVSKRLANSVVQETDTLLPLQKSKNNAALQNSGPSTIVVQSILDGQVIGESVVDVVSGKQYSNASIHALTRGVSGI